MGKVIDLFNNRQVDHWFFSQFTDIRAAVIRNNRIHIRLGIIPVHRRKPGKRDIFDLSNQPKSDDEPKLVIPPLAWLRRLNCDLWDPDNSYQAKACFVKAERHGNYIVITSDKLSPPIAETLELSKKTILMINGPDNQSLLANFSDVDTRQKIKRT